MKHTNRSYTTVRQLKGSLIRLGYAWSHEINSLSLKKMHLYTTGDHRDILDALKKVDNIGHILFSFRYFTRQIEYMKIAQIKISKLEKLKNISIKRRQKLFNELKRRLTLKLGEPHDHLFKYCYL
jgi:translation initiation factor 2 alpha subunit (eIF-2alpha)